MKKNIYTLLLWVAVVLAACSTDDSTIASRYISDIAISGLDPDGYSVVSYSGNTLNVSAQAQTDYPESEINYKWYVYPKKTGAFIGSHKVERELIGDGKILNYEINLAPGLYSLVCEVTASNGYSAFIEAPMNVTTNFSQGFYIMKETAEGNSEIDLYDLTQKTHLSDLMHATTGDALQGTPLAVTATFDHSYIDHDTNEQTGGSLITLTTKSGVMRTMRTTDLSCVFNVDNIGYEPFASNEYPIGIISGYWTNFLVTSDGFANQYISSFGGGSGKYGLKSGGGASLMIAADNAGGGLAFWNEKSHSIIYCDYNGGMLHYDDIKYPTDNLTDYDCLYCGSCYLNGSYWFLLKSRTTGEQLLYKFSDCYISGVTKVASDSHLAHATSYSTSINSSSSIYVIDGGKLYLHNIENGEEIQAVAKGIPAGTSLSYVSAKLYSTGVNINKAEYLILGTQQGDSYTLYFYNVLGGQPDGEPVAVTNGTGKLKSIVFTNPSVNTMYYGFPPFMD